MIGSVVIYPLIGNSLVRLRVLLVVSSLTRTPFFDSVLSRVLFTGSCLMDDERRDYWK